MLAVLLQLLRCSALQEGQFIRHCRIGICSFPLHAAPPAVAMTVTQQQQVAEEYLPLTAKGECQSASAALCLISRPAWLQLQLHAWSNQCSSPAEAGCAWRPASAEEAL